MFTQAFEEFFHFLEEYGRFWFPKRETKSLEEFIDFVREKKVEYVTVHGHQRITMYTSDSASLVYYTRAVAITPLGRTFAYLERLSEVYGDEGHSALVKARRRQKGAVTRLHKKLKTALNTTDADVRLHL